MGADVTTPLRTESSRGRGLARGRMAGAAAALLERQRAFVQPPGLIADGRDMGTVVFPECRSRSS